MYESFLAKKIMFFFEPKRSLQAHLLWSWDAICSTASEEKSEVSSWEQSWENRLIFCKERIHYDFLAWSVAIPSFFRERVQGFLDIESSTISCHQLLKESLLFKDHLSMFITAKIHAQASFVQTINSWSLWSLLSLAISSLPKFKTWQQNCPRTLFGRPSWCLDFSGNHEKIVTGLRKKIAQWETSPSFRGSRKMRKSRKTPQQSGEPIEPTSHNQLLNLSEKDATLQT